LVIARALNIGKNKKFIDSTLFSIPVGHKSRLFQSFSAALKVAFVCGGRGITFGDAPKRGIQYNHRSLRKFYLLDFLSSCIYEIIIFNISENKKPTTKL